MLKDDQLKGAFDTSPIVRVTLKLLADKLQMGLDDAARSAGAILALCDKDEVRTLLLAEIEENMAKNFLEVVQIEMDAGLIAKRLLADGKIYRDAHDAKEAYRTEALKQQAVKVKERVDAKKTK